MQFSINFDPSVLNFISAETFNLTNFNVGAGGLNMGMAAAGIGTVSWFTTGGPVSLSDGTTIIELCFELIGSGGDCSPITISSNPSPIEVTDFISQNNQGMEPLEPLINPGEVCVENFNPNGISLNMDDKTVCIGENFCVDITVEDFFEIRTLGFSVNWNSNVLDFNGCSDIQNINPDFTTLTCNSFDFTQINQGKLGLDWDSGSIISHETLSDGEVLFTLCFTVVGNGGTNSIVSITNDPQEIIVVSKDSTPDNIGMNTNSSLITVKPSQGITVIASDGEGFPGEQVCVNFSVLDFEEIVRTQFTINWNGSGQVLEYFS